MSESRFEEWYKKVWPLLDKTAGSKKDALRSAYEAGRTHGMQEALRWPK